MPVLRKSLARHKKYGNPKGLPTAEYRVVKPVQNLHINGVKVSLNVVVTLTAAAAQHWLHEGVLQAVPATADAPAASPSDPAA